MAITPLHLESVTSRPDLGVLEDAQADLETSRVFAEAAESIFSDLRTWVKMNNSPETQMVLRRINDCETLVLEAKCKAKGADALIRQYVEAEFSARRNGGNLDGC